MGIVVVVVVEYLYSASRSASNAQRPEASMSASYTIVHNNKNAT